VAGLILASRSPQRRAILQQLGIQFEVVTTDVEELEDGRPEEVAVENAFRKAAAAAAAAGTGVTVLGVDTVVCVDARIYGKAGDAGEARATLRALSGRPHTVIGGICLTDERGPRTAVVQTRVEFRTLSEGLIEWYLGTGEWRERAGGYAIQGRGAALVHRIDGDYLNVVGLPLGMLLDLAPWLLGPGVGEGL
jgi:septum formation protein